jgi:hypothetical protein
MTAASSAMEPRFNERFLLLCRVLQTHGWWRLGGCILVQLLKAVPFPVGATTLSVNSQRQQLPLSVRIP